MSRSRLLAPALVLALLPACQDKPGEPAKDGKAAAEVEPGKSPTEVEPKPAEPTPVPDEAGAEQDETGEVEPPPPLPEEFEKLGVATCDEYVERYVACIESKVPEAEREAQRRIVFDNISAWKQTAAGGPAGAKAIEIGCKSATQQAKRATQDWGCEW